jgi:hypothetical protein
MLRRIGAHIRNQWIGTVALFLVLTGGTAMAVDGSLPGQNTVGSADIINGEVTQNDIAADSVGSAKIVDQSVKNNDLGLGASSSNTIADGGVQGIDVKDNSLKGDDIDESSLQGIGSGSAILGSGGLRSFAGDVCSSPTNCPLQFNRNVTSVTNPTTGAYCIEVSNANPADAALIASAESSDATKEVRTSNAYADFQASVCGPNGYYIETFFGDAPSNAVSFSFIVVR